MSKELWVIHNKYQLERVLGSGSFGKVCQGRILRTNEEIAIKIENREHTMSSLQHEATVLNYLYSEGCRTIPAIVWYGVWNQYRCLAMSLFECSLFSYVIENPVSIDTANNLLQQAIITLEYIHDKKVLHRDIKPQNWMLKGKVLHLIDFGLSTFYVNEDGEHIPIKENKTEIIGSPKYCSIHIHDGIEPSRRDDLISLGHVYLYLLLREVPWNTLVLEQNDDPFDEIDIRHYKNKQRKQMKSRVHLNTLFAQSGSPILSFLDQCYSLSYEERPKYKRLMQLFETVSM